MNDAATQRPCGFRVSGLPLGKYTIRVTNNSGGSSLGILCFDVITPVHSPKNNALADLQNTLPIGSCTLGDMRPITMERSKGKYRGIAIGVSSNPSTSSTTYVPVPDMSLTVKSNGAWFEFNVNMNHQQAGGNNTFIVFFVNGRQVGPDNSALATTIEGGYSNSTIAYLDAGVHKVDVYWKVGAGSVNSNGVKRQLTVKEL
jgi:hypothetical protein